jgi:hypothetical protein
MARELETLLKETVNTLDSSALDKRSRDLEAISNRVQGDLKSVLNHAFLLGAGLILLALVGALAYRRLTGKRERSSTGRPAV